MHTGLGLSTSCSRFPKKFPVISQKFAQKSKVAQTKIFFFFCLSSFSLMQKYSRTFRKRPPKIRILGGRLCTSQFQIRPSPPPRANPGAFDFFEKFWSNSPLCCQFRRSNVPPVRASKRVKSLTLQAS